MTFLHLDGPWFTEIHKGIAALSFRIEETLFSGKSPYQQVDIIQTAGHGRMLLNDGMVMISERDEFVYHEMIAHVPLFVHPNPKRVLIIGGGDGGTVREVVRHKTVDRVVMVEIDEMVVNACRQHIPSVSCALDDPKLELIFDDGVQYVASSGERFDVVIIDSTDPVGPATPLFNREFYENTSRILNETGILITQAESPYYDPDIQLSMLSNQRPFFNKLHVYQMTNMTYPGGLWSFGFASNRLCPITDFNLQRVNQSGMTFRYYNSRIHQSAFVLPTFLEGHLESVINPIPHNPD